MKKPILWSLLSLLAWSGTVPADNPDPTVGIPFAGRPPFTAEKPEFIAGNWERAAVLRIFTTDNGSGSRPVPAATTLRLLHDQEAVYAAWQCAAGKAPLTAFPRRSMDNLILDESVQLLLGLAGGHTVRQDMGGYANAQNGALEKVEHFYEFTVNAAGALSRSYNETLLPEPRFAAWVLPGKGAYTVLMRIPFAAWGTTPEASPRIYFNAFRFHHAVRYGWQLPAFGNYAAMPFGTADLLPPGAPAAPKQETALTPPPASAPVPANAAPAEIAAVQMDYYPLARRVCAVFPAESSKRKAVVRVPALHLEQEAALDPWQPRAVNLTLPELPAGQKYTAEAFFRDGTQAGPVKRLEFTAIAPPDWYGAKAGMEYAADRVPRPWSAPRWDHGVLTLSTGDWQFGSGVLPESITVRGRRLLAAPLRLNAEFQGETTPLPLPARIRETAEPTRVDLRTAAGIELRTLVDFDGFTVVRVRFPGRDARKLRTLALEIPLPPGVAEYLARETVQSVIKLGAYDYFSNGGTVWIGNESLGIAFIADKPVFFSEPDGRQLQLRREASGGAVLRLDFVTAAGQVPRADQVFQFYLLPTPSRNEPPPPTHNRMINWFEQWSDYQGYPDLAKLPQAQERSAAAHAEGKRLFMYSSQCLAENSPEAELWGKEWYAPPTRQWYRRAYDPGKGVPCRVSCFRGAAGELLLSGFSRLVKEAGLDGIYMDGPSYPFNCENPSHRCSDNLPADFDDDARSGRILGQRQFLKRLRGVFDAAGKESPLWAHTGGGLDLATLSLCDYFYEGEQLSRYRQGYLIDPAIFTIGYSGKAFGFRGIFLPVNYADATGSRRALNWGLTHDVEAIFEHPEDAQTQNAFLKPVRETPGTRFYPYYQEQPHLRRLSSDGALVSYYKNDQVMHLAAANLRYIGPQTVTIDLTPAFGSGAVEVYDFGLRTRTLLKDGILTFDVPEAGSRQFRIALPEPPAKMPANELPDFKPIRGVRTADWQTRNAGVPAANNPIPAAAAAMLLRVVSPPPGGAEGIIAFDGKLPAEFTLRGVMVNQDCFELRLNDLGIKFNSWDGWSASGLAAEDETGRRNLKGRPRTADFHRAMNRAVPVELAVADGRVTFRYDGITMLDRALLAHPAGAYELRFAVWGGKHLALDIAEIVPETQPGTNAPDATAITAATPPPVKGYRSEDWEILHPGPTPADNPPPNFPLPLKVVSLPPGGPEGVIQLKKPLPSEFTLRFNLLHQNCFRLALNDFSLSFNSWSGWRVEGVHDSDPYGVCTAWTRWLNGGFYSVMDRPVPVVVAVRDGRITLSYDHHLLLRNFLLENPAQSYEFKAATWSQKWLMLDPVELSFQFEPPAEAGVRHPVR